MKTVLKQYPYYFCFASAGDAVEIQMRRIRRAATPPSSLSRKILFPKVENGSTEKPWASIGRMSPPPRPGSGQSDGPQFTDATAVLQKLNWASDQKATAQVATTGAPLEDCFQEVELRLRTVIAPHSITGYEVNYKFSNDSTGYMQIVRWNGNFADFTILQSFDGLKYGVSNGDVVSATVVGNVITAYKNGVQQGQATDNTFASGSPGIGFNLTNDVSGCPGTNGNYGFSSFSALDTTQGSF